MKVSVSSSQSRNPKETPLRIKMHILFLSQRVPYPPNRGDKITTWHIIERLKRKHRVTCVCFAHGREDLEAAQKLDQLGIPTSAIRYNSKLALIRSIPTLLSQKPLTLCMYGSGRLQHEVDRIIPTADVAYAYSSSMGAFLEKHVQLPRIMHFAELDSDKWLQYSSFTNPAKSWVYRREWQALLKFERRIARSFTQNIFCTPLEQKIFQKHIPEAPSIVIRNGVDFSHFTPRPERAQRHHLVFSGVMDYFPNVDGCIYFAREVLPQVRTVFPDAHFTIVGARPVARVRKLAASSHITVTGYVHDTRTYLEKGTVSVAPLRMARGIQNKVLEALAMGLPVIGTTSATQGIEGEPGRDFMVEDDANKQAAAICSLLADPIAARAMGQRGRLLVEKLYDWNNVLEPLDQLIDEMESKMLAART
jgi:sugar transferase (PEP-CTERM/EpsH1 system associated)